MLSFFKKHLAVNQNSDWIEIGFGAQYHRVPYSKETHELLRKCIEEGVDDTEIDQYDLYKALLAKDMLTSGHMLTRHESFFDYVGAGELAQVVNTPIIIFGAGAAGATLCYLLGQLGFQYITIIDDDIVEQSDIDKTMVYRRDHLGLCKVDALKLIFRETFQTELTVISARPSTKVEIRHQIIQADASLVVKACDPNPVFRLYLNEVCRVLQVPFLHMAYSYETIRMGPLFVPGATPCDECQMHAIAKATNNPAYSFAQHTRLFEDQLFHPSINFNINLLSNYMLKDIVLFLLGKYEYVNSLGKLIIVRTLDMVKKELPLEKLCSTCLQDASASKAD